MVRLISHSEIDDVSPGMPCDEEYLKKSDILWIIPIFDNQSISDNKEWCKQILSLNKTLGLHGVYHTYKEFKEPRDSSYLQEGISAFESCFNQTPTLFKPPQLAWTGENKPILKQFNFSLKSQINQITHKVYHCNDSGQFSNKLMDSI